MNQTESIASVGKMMLMYEWGFNLTDFPHNGFKKLLQELGISLKVHLVRRESFGFNDFLWSGNNLEILTHCNPLTGEFQHETLKQRKDRLDYAGYMGLRSTDKGKLERAVSFIRRYGDTQWYDESEGESKFIEFPPREKLKT